MPDTEARREWVGCGECIHFHQAAMFFPQGICGSGDPPGAFKHSDVDGCREFSERRASDEDA